jgi:hypothetical protein
MPHQRARIDVPDDRNLMAVQIKLRGLRAPPVRRNLGELPHDQRFDVRPRGFFVVQVCADVPDVRVGQADDLPGIAWIGEDFLVSGETCIENDLASAARDRAGGPAVKDAPVFQRKNSGTVRNLGQLFSLRRSFFLGIRLR